ncbi:MAG TPA: hypothetical protein VF746_25485 [Longimicrobium sp.]|jgi:hypothetical protein
MDFEVIKEAAFLVLMFIVFGIPALAIAARIAIRPVAEAILRLREASAAPPNPSISAQRFAALEAEVMTLRDRVEDLSESAAFDRQLRAGGESAAGPLGRDHEDRGSEPV